MFQVLTRITLAIDNSDRKLLYNDAVFLSKVKHWFFNTVNISPDLFFFHFGNSLTRWVVMGAAAIFGGSMHYAPSGKQNRAPFVVGTRSWDSYSSL